MGMVFNVALDGLSYGMVLFMISVGLSVTLGLMRVINLAHGGFALLGGALMHGLTFQLGWPFALALPVSVLSVTLIALPMEYVFFRPLYGKGDLTQVLATIGLTFLMIAFVNWLYGSALLGIPLPPSLRGTVDLGLRTLPVQRVAVIVTGIVVLGALYGLIERTRFGIWLRASVDNRAAAEALGINTRWVFAATFALGAGLAALGGVLGAELMPIEAYYPLRYLVVILAVVAVGGMGSVWGAWFAALGLGLIDTAARYALPDFGTIFFFAALIVVLALRPQGLSGRAYDV